MSDDDHLHSIIADYGDACAEMQAEIDRLRAQLAAMTDDYMRRHKDAVDHLERAMLAEAELATACAQRDAAIAASDGFAIELAETKARIAELEAAGNRLGAAAITGILDGNDFRARAERAEASHEQQVIVAANYAERAERAEAELKAVREALKDMIEITEDIPHYAQRARVALAQSPAEREG